MKRKCYRCSLDEANKSEWFCLAVIFNVFLKCQAMAMQNYKLTCTNILDIVADSEMFLALHKFLQFFVGNSL